MKKVIFSICALAAVAVGCNKSELISEDGANTPISFETYAGKAPVSKATSVVGQDGLAAAGGFQVYAFIHGDEAVTYNKTYMNKVVTGTVDDKDKSVAWSYEGITYWPTTHKLDFVAYALNCGANVKANADSPYTVIDYTVADAVADQTDLLVANPVVNRTSASTEGGDAVHLVFNHMLARVGFSLVTSNGNAVPVTVQDVKLSGKFAKTGTVDLTATAPAITPATAEDVTYDLLANGTFTSVGSVDGKPVFDNSMLYEFKEGEADNDFDDKYEAVTETDDLKEAAAKSEANRHMMIIPTSAHNAKLSVTYFLPEAGESFVVENIDLSTLPFEAGKSYEFKFKVSTNAVGFTVEVTVWDETGNAGDVIQLS